MEARGAVWLFPWTSLGFLLISGAAMGTTSSPVYTMDSPVQIDIPQCNVPTGGSVEWKANNKRLQKGNIPISPANLDNICKCKIQPNGALYLEHLEKEGDMTYVVHVYDDKGNLICNKSVTVTGQYPVDTPVLSLTCKDKKRVEVNCRISQGSSPTLLLTFGDKSHTTQGLSLNQTVKIESSTNFTCSAKNQVRETFQSSSIICDEGGWNLLLILASAAGGVAFIIFIVLIVYSVRSCKRPDEEAMYSNNRRQVIQERQLPQPPVQAGAPPPNVTTTDETEYIPSQRPPTQKPGAPETAPRGKKGRRARPRPPEPPQGQPESLPLNPTPQQTRPELPGNHPNDQPPKPTPRTKSKPARHNRKSR